MKFCLYFLQSSHFDTMRRNVHNNSLKKCEFHDNGYRESHILLLSDLMNLHLYFLFFSDLDIIHNTDLSIMLFRVCRSSKGLTFLTGSNETTYMCVLTPLSVSLPLTPTTPSTFITWWSWGDRDNDISEQVYRSPVCSTAVGHTQLPQTIVIMDTDLVLSSNMCSQHSGTRIKYLH
jgi:hypothetical protein